MSQCQSLFYKGSLPLTLDNCSNFCIVARRGAWCLLSPKAKRYYEPFCNSFALFGYSAPVFWTGILLLIAFSLQIPLFPVAGMRDVTIEGNFWIHTIDIIKHMVLPVVTLASIFLALYSRLARATMIETLGTDFVRTARAKGLHERQVVYKHALRNSVSPVVTLAGLQFSAVVSGAVLVEAVFSWPGLGTLAFQSIIARDTPTILGILFFSALVVIIGNLLTDLVLRLWIHALELPNDR